jgi:hypothetical protein
MCETYFDAVVTPAVFTFTVTYVNSPRLPYHNPHYHHEATTTLKPPRIYFLPSVLRGHRIQLANMPNFEAAILSLAIFSFILIASLGKLNYFSIVCSLFDAFFCMLLRQAHDRGLFCCLTSLCSFRLPTCHDASAADRRLPGCKQPNINSSLLGSGMRTIGCSGNLMI